MAEPDSSIMAPNYAEIVVVRHGETEWNVEGKLQGQSDVELNEVGKEQATAAGNRLSKEREISTFYTSDLKRALETTQIIANFCGGDLEEIVQDKDLRERHLGDLQGLKSQEAAKLKPEAYQAFVSRTRDQEIPGGGESLNQVYERCTTAVQKYAEKHLGERIVVVTHGGVIKALQKRASPKKRFSGQIENASVNVFHLSDKGDWSIELWNDVSHIDEMEASEGFEF